MALRLQDHDAIDQLDQAAMFVINLSLAGQVAFIPDEQFHFNASSYSRAQLASSACMPEEVGPERLFEAPPVVRR
ncbi:hypothetical protein GCM10027046_09980 [Uliginosibacterium flavum]